MNSIEGFRNWQNFTQGGNEVEFGGKLCKTQLHEVIDIEETIWSPSWGLKVTNSLVICRSNGLFRES